VFRYFGRFPFVVVFLYPGHCYLYRAFVFLVGFCCLYLRQPFLVGFHLYARASCFGSADFRFCTEGESVTGAFVYGPVWQFSSTVGFYFFSLFNLSGVLSNEKCSCGHFLLVVGRRDLCYVGLLDLANRL
jgi:hypothetical protein